MKAFLLILLIIGAISQLCSDIPTQLTPFDISSQSIATYTNLEVHSYQSSNSKITINPNFTTEGLHLQLKGDFGIITIDENVNFLYGENPIQIIYTCNDMRFYMPSLNKYWVSQHVDIEIIMLCAKAQSIGQFHNYSFTDTIIFTIPLIEIVSSSPNEFLNTLASALKTNQPSFDYSMFDFDKVFLESDELNQSTQFYFFNANNPFQCDIPLVTWFVLNNFIKLPTDVMMIYKNYFKGNNLVNNLTDYYSKKNDVSINVRRNFYINENFSLFEEEMIALSKENDYLNAMCIHIDLIIFLINIMFII